VTLAAIYLIVMGVLVALFGGCAASIGGLVGSADPSAPGLGGIGALIAGFGLVIAVIGIIGIVAGAGVLGGKSWGRWTGIIISIIFALLLIFSGVTSLTAQNGMTGAVVSLVLGILYALSAWALIQANAYFARR
jgi:hypothetical protein